VITLRGHVGLTTICSLLFCFVLHREILASQCSQSDCQEHSRSLKPPTFCPYCICIRPLRTIDRPLGVLNLIWIENQVLEPLSIWRWVDQNDCRTVMCEIQSYSSQSVCLPETREIQEWSVCKNTGSVRMFCIEVYTGLLDSTRSIYPCRCQKSRQNTSCHGYQATCGKRLQWSVLNPTRWKEQSTDGKAVNLSELRICNKPPDKHASVHAFWTRMSDML
jgi:hypothetical protein